MRLARSPGTREASSLASVSESCLSCATNCSSLPGDEANANSACSM